MGSFWQSMQKKTQSCVGRFVCVLTMIGICLLFYGCGAGVSMEDMVPEENIVQVPEENVVQSSEEADAGAFEIPSLEQLFTYEEIESSSEQYLVITGIADKYRERFQECLIFIGIPEKYRESYMRDMDDKEWLDMQRKCLNFPADVNGVPVREIGEFAFADLEMDGVELTDSIKVVGEGAFRNTKITELKFSTNLETIGDAAFENCNLERVEFPEALSFIGDRAFAGNTGLWTVLIHKVDVEIAQEAFADCDADFLLCYEDDTDDRENLAAKYARENGLESMEIILSQTPIIHYPEEPYILQPRIGNFFYGDYEDLEEEKWCTWEEDENAPNFGYSDWQWSGCSSWCGVVDFELTAEASSELTSASGRYCVENVLVQNRDAAWSEGADGYGIGESITYRQSCTTLDNKWKAIRPDCLTPINDGFMRYTEICIVNGYAKDQKTWEENGRIKRLNMYVEDKLYAYLDLADTILPQYFTLPEEDIKVLSGGMIEVRFEIAEVYPGSVYEDTCLTGLIMEFSGRYAH